MIRIAALYDIHGNLPALEAVLGEVKDRGADIIVVGGDVVPGPMPHECLSLLRSLDADVRFIMGNGDRETLAARTGTVSDRVRERSRETILWSAQQLTDQDADAMRSWPPTLQLDIEEYGRVLFCHATPRNDTDVFTRLTPESALTGLFDGAHLAVCGHTHMQFERMIGATRVVNAGSVGMPFGEPGAYWLEIAFSVTLRRTEYDRDDAARRVRATSYPQADEFAASNVLKPPAEEAMLAAFTRAGLQ